MHSGERGAHLVWRHASVGGRRVNYGVAGVGLPVLFLHGWALGARSYKRAMKRLVRLGCRVVAPALPGFGGSAQLAGRDTTLAGYAAWADAFLDEVGVDEPALVAGHSLGGAVAAQFAHDFPDRVAHLVLINAIGGGVWSAAAGTVRSMAERPLWDWAVTLSRDISGASAAPVLRVVAEEALPNLAANPLAVWRAAAIARRADLCAELSGIRRAGVPVTVVSSEGDLVVPKASFEAICGQLGVEGRLVEGGHSWLIADPDAFVEAVLPAVAAARASRAAMARLPLAASQ
ncbi:MAG TPA: alpha/beta hydrolase [Acidimicrobiales bacterium]|nr:alpha/beta hydrolase [Acidimicrobiales bacterium]